VFDLKSRLFRFGVIASILWLVMGVAFLWVRGNWSVALKPNEWGDVFAGLAAPMAFLWLVLGFLQQGQELKLSTQALLLQVDELKNTVEHQRQLVEVTREQVAASVRQGDEDRLARRRAAQPNLVLSQAGSTSGGQGITYNVQLSNQGAAATNVHVRVDAASPAKNFFPTIAPQEEKRFTLSYPTVPKGDVVVGISYTDRDGASGQVSFVGKEDGRNGIRFDLQQPPESGV
jgi:hypothetical protein